MYSLESVGNGVCSICVCVCVVRWKDWFAQWIQEEKEKKIRDEKEVVSFDLALSHAR